MDNWLAIILPDRFFNQVVMCKGKDEEIWVVRHAIQYVTRADERRRQVGDKQVRARDKGVSNFLLIPQGESGSRQNQPVDNKAWN